MFVVELCVCVCVGGEGKEIEKKGFYFALKN